VRPVERLLLLAVAAVTWPFWLPFLTAVLKEIRAAAESEPEAPATPRRRAERLVNAAWDDAHLRVPERRGERAFGRSRGARGAPVRGGARQLGR
jgi:hypothetical protein